MWKTAAERLFKFTSLEFAEGDIAFQAHAAAAERLFKFTSLEFAEGDIAFQAHAALYLFVALLAALLVGLTVIYAVTNQYPSRRMRAVSWFLRVLAVLLLCLPLFEPALLVPDIIPSENFLVVLADKSASMSIRDGYYGSSRDDDVAVILKDSENGILPDLEENFKVRYYTFGAEPERVDSLASRAPEGEETNVTAALQRVLADFKGLPLTGIVLLSDGADNSIDDPYNVIEELHSRNVPLHVVGLGKETFEQERELLDITTSKGLEEGTGAEIDVKVRSWIDETSPVAFSIYRGEDKVFSEERFLKGSGKIDYFTFFYEPDKKGAVEYTLQIDPLAHEINTDNNSLNMLIDTRKDTIRVLYFEGHLRSDFKFIKRALDDDQVVEFTSLSRTGTNKYYRQGQDAASVDILAGGFPTTEEDLYRFKAVIFGDIEASYFSIEQLEMIEKFVRERWGGFLMLGGLNSFAEGDYYNSPVADVLPVEIDPSRRMVLQPQFYHYSAPAVDQGFQFLPTREGLENPVLKLSSDMNENYALWNEMPHLTSINYFGAVKPGATVLAKKPDDRFGGEEPLLVIQRYGRGRSAALGTSSTWRWQLMLDHEDQRHERFWRQLVRWLVLSAPDNVNINLADNLFAPGDEIPVRVNVFDDDYNPYNFVDVKGKVAGPSGQVQEIAFHPELTEDGEYVAAFVPWTQGVYRIDAAAEKDGEFLGSHNQSILVRPTKKEFYDATLRRRFLAGLARESGGVYYTPEEAAALPVNLKTRKTSTSILREEYIWDMPFLFILALLLLSAEWIYRRRKGLP